MLSNDRILTTSILATRKNWSWSTSRRHRSTRQARKSLRSEFSSSKIEFKGLRVQPRLQSFIPWLIPRLQGIEKKSSDAGYVTFIRNLLAIVTNPSFRPNLKHQTQSDPSRIAGQSSGQLRPSSLLASLKKVYYSHGGSAVESQLKYSYHGLHANQNFSKADIKDQEKLADLRYPIEWYPATRTIQRKIILHVGPTNSGKTYQALKRLEEAESGIYAGPLRLLAQEVYTRLNVKGRKCDLVTGDERNAHEGSRVQSCTVEMVPLNETVDVAVIDEIQMIGNKSRGWAWTQALLGLKAKEVHLCGEERSVPLVRELAALMGDQLEIHGYQRLSPLETMTESLDGKLSNLMKGDCIVVFSRIGLHAMKRRIEDQTQKRVAIIYGSLPPEVRAQQARLFNDPNNDYDYIVASDAIGMGLNLAIKRIIFESVSKFNGTSLENIDNAHLKQIAGRAGRYRTAAEAESSEDQTSSSTTPIEPPVPSSAGAVTTLHKEHLPILRRAMAANLDPIMTAGILPPTSVLNKFATYFPPTTNFSYILLRLHELSLQHPRYHLCDLGEQTAIADIIHSVPNLTTHDRIIFCAAPANVQDPASRSIVEAFARCVGEHSSGALLDIPEIPLDVLNEPMKVDRTYMLRLESLHHALILYLWLSYRFAGVFIDQAMAFYVKGLVEEKIDRALTEYSASPAIMEKIGKLEEKTLRQISKVDKIESIVERPEDQRQNPNPVIELEDASAYGQQVSKQDSHIVEQIHSAEQNVEGPIHTSP